MNLILATGNPLGFLDAFGIEWKLLISQGLSFGIVAVALYWFVFKPVIKVSDKRRAEISKGIEDAKAAHEKLAKSEKTAKDELAKAAKEATEILAKARDSAKESIELAAKEARIKAEEIRQKSEDQSRIEIARMRDELKEELSGLVKKAAIEVVGSVLTEEQKGKLSEEAARNITGK